MYPTLFKRTSIGATQIWRQELKVDEDTGLVYVRSVSGQKDGKHVESTWGQVKGKNQGKSNETSDIQQAELEIQAAYTKKLAQGQYRENEDDIDVKDFFKPMLAKNFDDYPVTEFINVCSQPKLDGVRCIADKDGLWTRQGKPIKAVPHIHEALAEIFESHPDLKLDGELYADKLKEDFGEIVSLVKKANPDQARLDRAAQIIEYHIYDLASSDKPFIERYAQLQDLFNEADMPYMIRLVETDRVTSQEHLDDLNGKYLEAGYEGQMVRTSDLPYEEGRRSKQLLKRKVFQDAEYKIVAIWEGQGNRSGMAGYITYELGDGRTFGSGIKGSHDYARQLLKDKDKYSNGYGTVKFFGLTPDGIPRFPVTIAVYEGKRDV